MDENIVWVNNNLITIEDNQSLGCKNKSLLTPNVELSGSTSNSMVLETNKQYECNCNS